MNTTMNQGTIGQKQQNGTMPIGPAAASQPGLAASAGTKVPAGSVAAGSVGASSVGEVKPSHAEIAARAFANYQNDGSTCGHCERNWMQAESELVAAGQATSPAVKSMSGGRL